MTDDPYGHGALLHFLLGHSGYLRHTVRVAHVTCQVCARPIGPRFSVCSRCHGHCIDGIPVADRVGSMIYGIDRRQSGKMMYAYKETPHGEQPRAIVTFLLAVGYYLHERCAAALAGLPVTHWATVPSLKPANLSHPVEHPLHNIVATTIMPRIPETSVAANPPITNARAHDPNNFTVSTAIPPAAHILLLEDTWTSGGHVQSVAAALKLAGAQQVSILTAARWLDLTEPVVSEFHRSHLEQQIYNPALCPWTAGPCPARNTGW